MLIAVCRDVLAKPLAAIQQEHLREQPLIAFGGRHRGKPVKPGDHARRVAHLRQRLEALRRVILETAQFVNDHRAIRPLLFPEVDKPFNCLAIDDVNAGRIARKFGHDCMPGHRFVQLANRSLDLIVGIVDRLQTIYCEIAVFPLGDIQAPGRHQTGIVFVRPQQGGIHPCRVAP